MHTTLFKGLAVAASTAVAVMVCGIGQASAAQLEPAHHGSAHLPAADRGVGRDVDLCAGLDVGLAGLDLGLDVCVAIWLGVNAGVPGEAGAGSAHNHR